MAEIGPITLAQSLHMVGPGKEIPPLVFDVCERIVAQYTITKEPLPADEVLRRLVAEGELEHYAVDYYGRPIYRRLSAEAGDGDRRYDEAATRDLARSLLAEDPDA
jgi:hypothetical protein